jgi:hypothetical protein
MLFGGDMSTLEHLIRPMSRQEFFGYYINQSPVVIHNRSPMRVAKLVNVNETSGIVHQGLTRHSVRATS